jgi:hypothetical protein
MASLLKEFEVSMKEGDPFADQIGAFIDQNVIVLDDLKLQL